MTLTEMNTNTQAAEVNRRKLKTRELKHVAGGVNSCCTIYSYKTGNYRKTRVGFVTVAEYEYFCSMCENTYWQAEIEYFE